MSSLLPDEYMATGPYEPTTLETTPESGFDDSSSGDYDQHALTEEWKPISHSDTFSAPAAFEEPTTQSNNSPAMAAAHMLASSAPVFYHPLSMPGPFTMHFQAGLPLPAIRENTWSAPAPNANNASSMEGLLPQGVTAPMADQPNQHAMYYPVALDQMHLDEMYQPRNRARNGSAPPMPIMMGPPVHWQPTTMLSSSYGDYHPLSASYCDMSGVSYSMTSPRKGYAGSRSSSRSRRPAGVPALSLGGLNGAPGSAQSPASANMMMTPHSGRSTLSSMSDFDAQFSPLSTPRSASSTPRSSTSTPRSAPINEKKRARTGLPHPLERERRVRPKVVAEKGALQCKGVNRKKNTRCRNAALMEFIGPRPLYCAEHITLDPDSFYSKCASTFHKVQGDGKGCREVVLKELQFCHKHYNQSLDVMLDGSEVGFLKARAQLERITALQTQLEAEASAAKRIDPDLFQRKHKLIPKFMEMRKLLVKRMQDLESQLGHLLPTPLEFGNKFEDQQESKDSSSVTSPSPSGSSDESSVSFEDSATSALMMQVEPQNYSIF